MTKPPKRGPGGAQPGAGRKPQAFCKRGHSLDPDTGNVYIDPRGYPVCRTCRADARAAQRLAEWRAAKRAALAAKRAARAEEKSHQQE